MKIQIVSLSVLTLAAMASAAPAYAVHGKAGVWQETTTSHMVLQGAAAGTDDKRTDTGKYCRTADEAQHDSPPKVGRDCTQHNVKWIGNTVSGDTVCGLPVKGAGKFNVTFTSNVHYTGGYAFDGTIPGGGPFRMTTSFTADWLGADCGKVKPLQ
jgi:hypothetical protein